MAQQQFAGLAVLVVLAFMVLALQACANSEQVAGSEFGPSMIAPIEPAPGVPEFHGASIGADTLRGHLDTE
jgi:hypothetical protein